MCVGVEARVRVARGGHPRWGGLRAVGSSSVHRAGVGTTSKCICFRRPSEKLLENYSRDILGVGLSPVSSLELKVNTEVTVFRTFSKILVDILIF